MPIQRDSRCLSQVQVVEGIEHGFEVVVQATVADEKAQTASGKVVAMYLGEAIARHG